MDAQELPALIAGGAPRLHPVASRRRPALTTDLREGEAGAGIIARDRAFAPRRISTRPDAPARALSGHDVLAVREL